MCAYFVYIKCYVLVDNIKPPECTSYIFALCQILVQHSTGHYG